MESRKISSTVINTMNSKFEKYVYNRKDYYKIKVSFVKSISDQNPTASNLWQPFSSKCLYSSPSRPQYIYWSYAKSLIEISEQWYFQQVPSSTTTIFVVYCPLTPITNCSQAMAQKPRPCQPTPMIALNSTPEHPYSIPHSLLWGHHIFFLLFPQLFKVTCRLLSQPDKFTSLLLRKI